MHDAACKVCIHQISLHWRNTVAEVEPRQLDSLQVRRKRAQLLRIEPHNAAQIRSGEPGSEEICVLHVACRQISR